MDEVQVMRSLWLKVNLKLRKLLLNIKKQWVRDISNYFEVQQLKFNKWFSAFFSSINFSHFFSTKREGSSTKSRPQKFPIISQRHSLCALTDDSTRNVNHRKSKRLHSSSKSTNGMRYRTNSRISRCSLATYCCTGCAHGLQCPCTCLSMILNEKTGFCWLGSTVGWSIYSNEFRKCSIQCSNL